jgi:hypothetical protein
MDNDQLAKSINTQIIDFILQSPLNVEFIPDEIERQMYEQILTIVEKEIIDNESKLVSLWDWLFSCCKKQKIT